MTTKERYPYGSDMDKSADESTNYAAAGMAAVGLVGLLTGVWYIAYKVLNHNVK